ALGFRSSQLGTVEAAAEQEESGTGAGFLPALERHGPPARRRRTAAVHLSPHGSHERRPLRLRRWLRSSWLSRLPVVGDLIDWHTGRHTAPRRYLGFRPELVQLEERNSPTPTLAARADFSPENPPLTTPTQALRCGGDASYSACCSVTNGQAG